MKNVFKLLTIMCILAMLGLGCGDEDSSDKNDDTNNTPANNANNTDDPPCESHDPGGDSCDEAGDCTVSCQCAEGAVFAGTCVGVCAAAADVCPGACDGMSAGAYTGEFCNVE